MRVHPKMNDNELQNQLCQLWNHPTNQTVHRKQGFIDVRFPFEIHNKITSLLWNTEALNQDTSTTARMGKPSSDINIIYECWNEQCIIIHRKITPDTTKAIKAALKTNTKEEILQSIRNYAKIQKGEQYWFKYAWTLKDFLKKGLAKFVDWEIASNNYLRHEGAFQYGAHKQNPRTIRRPEEYTQPDALRHN